jgi:hypothetical protein
MSNLGASDALEVVKDGAKFKARLKELADAEENLAASQDKVKKRNKVLNAEFDDMTALMAKTIEDGNAKAKSINESANGAMRPVEKAKGELAKEKKAFVKLVEKYDFDMRQFVLQKAKLADEETAFLERVAEFEDGVLALLASVK